MGVSTREQDDRTWLDTDLPLSLAAICWAGIVGMAPVEPDPRIFPSRGALHLLYPEALSPGRPVVEMTLWLALQGRNRAIPYGLRLTPCDSKPGRR